MVTIKEEVEVLEGEFRVGCACPCAILSKIFCSVIVCFLYFIKCYLINIYKVIKKIDVFFI